MKYRYSVLVALTLLPMPVLAQVDAPSSVSTEVRYSKEEKAVLAAHELRRSALLGNDFAALERLLSERLAYIHSSGKVDTRATLLSSLKTGTLRYERLEMRNSTLQYSSKLSMVGGETTIQVRTPSGPVSFDAYYTAVYTHDRKNGWQLIRWQTTRLAAPELPK